MRLDDCYIGQEVATSDGSVGYLIGNVVSVGRVRVRIQFRDRHHPKPVSINPLRIWSMDEQITLTFPDENEINGRQNVAGIPSATARTLGA